MHETERGMRSGAVLIKSANEGNLRPVKKSPQIGPIVLKVHRKRSEKMREAWLRDSTQKNPKGNEDVPRRENWNLPEGKTVRGRSAHVKKSFKGECEKS